MHNFFIQNIYFFKKRSAEEEKKILSRTNQAGHEQSLLLFGQGNDARCFKLLPYPIAYLLAVDEHVFNTNVTTVHIL